MKTCANCKQTKLFTDFNKSKDRKDGHNPYCKACCLQYRFENKEILSQKKKEYCRLVFGSDTGVPCGDDNFRVSVGISPNIPFSWRSLG